MDKIKLLVTPYMDPDLDGTACAYGYVEYLCKNGRDAIAGIFGTPYREAQFVMNKFNIPKFVDANSIIGQVDKIIIVDASDTRGLSKRVDPKKVIEVIDHRKINDADSFPNAIKQIEMVGSAATLIAEKFHQNGTEISLESAALLFSAIVSNTINFRANVTTDRDHKMANWCKKQFPLQEGYVHEMFSDKSKFEGSLKDKLIFATFNFNNRDLGIAQLEIINAEDFVRNNLGEIKKILAEKKVEKSLDSALLTCIDLENAFNIIIVSDNETKKLIEQALSMEFENEVGKKNGILMRKEIVPLIKKTLENSL